MDPATREFYIGLGCALENLALAAQAAGVTGRVTLLPEPDQPLLVGRLELGATQPTQSPLYGLIGRRHVNRGPYDPAHAVPAEAFAELQRLSEAAGVGVRWFTDSEERRRFGEITVAATEAFIADREQSEAAFAWFRGSPHEVEHYRDGLTLDTQGMSPGMLMLAKVAPSASREQGDQFWLTNTRDVHLASAPAFGMLLVEQPGALDWLRAGRAWQRMHLWATAKNLALQPLDQSLQRAEREARLGLSPEIAAEVTDLIATPRYSAALPFRVGYPMQASVASPRRSVKTVLV